jgi:hypothetical protein
MPYDTSLLQSSLRSLEEGIVASLKTTFEGADVRAHTGEVDADSVRRLSLAKLGLLATVAMGIGSTSSPVDVLRMDVTWGIFIVASPRVVDGAMIPAISVGASFTDYVLRLAYQAKWGLGNAISPCKPGDIRFSNLGVGLKATKDFAENEKIALFVVWGRQQLELGQNIPDGGVELPPFEIIEGVIQDQPAEGDKPEIGIHEVIEQSSLVARIMARVRGVGRPKLAVRPAANDDVYRDAAVQINGFVSGELRRAR